MSCHYNVSFIVKPPDTMKWDRVVELLKIQIERYDDREYYNVKVYIPCFKTKLHMKLAKMDYEVITQVTYVTIEEIIQQKIVQQYELEKWLSTKIK